MSQQNRPQSRPLSPHIQIYRWQITMFISILHRVSGIGLGLGAILVTVWLMTAATSDNAFYAFQNFCASLPGKLMLYCWLLGFVFHFMNGVRHLIWDAGFGINKSSAAASGWFVFFGSIVVSALLWFMVH